MVRQYLAGGAFNLWSGKIQLEARLADLARVPLHQTSPDHYMLIYGNLLLLLDPHWLGSLNNSHSLRIHTSSNLQLCKYNRLS